jgi:DNA-binding LacI/PurR family transcriptional regulator
MTTLHDVARKAGVSVSTVSRVVNGAPSVDAALRVRVERVVRELDYRPSRVARRLRQKDGKRNIIGLLVPDIQNPFYVDVVRGVEDVVYANDYAVFMCNFGQDERKKHLYLEIMASEEVDGLIAAPFNEDDKEIRELIEQGMSVVCVDRGLTGQDVDVVTVNNFEGAYEAVRLLTSLGHQKIGFIGGLKTIPTSRERHRGYMTALSDVGVTPAPEHVRFGDSKLASGRHFADEMLSLDNRPTALFTGNNLITLGALESIHARGLEIPRDVAVVGFDDMIWADSLNPPLTAVSQPGYEIGRRATELLFRRIAEPDAPAVQLVLKTTLHVRRSCGSGMVATDEGSRGDPAQRSQSTPEGYHV